MQEGGEYVPAFPNATYYVQRGEWDDAENADGQTVNGYRYDEVMRPLAPVLTLLAGDESICSLIEAVVTPGHTRRHQSVLVHTGEDTFCFVGDLIPTTHHLKPIYVLAYDLYPRQTYLVKQEVMERAVSEDWVWCGRTIRILHGGDCDEMMRGLMKSCPFSPIELTNTSSMTIHVPRRISTQFCADRFLRKEDRCLVGGVILRWCSGCRSCLERDLPEAGALSGRYLPELVAGSMAPDAMRLFGKMGKYGSHFYTEERRETWGKSVSGMFEAHPIWQIIRIWIREIASC